MENKFSSKEYWIKRYDNGGNSGVGSFGQIAEYKASIINDFIEKKDLKSVLELGCGDGYQLSLFNVKLYNGYDVSNKVVKDNQIKFSNYKFSTNIEDFTKQDLTISLDVILHLIEDSVYEDYMKMLFNMSNKYVIIYSANIDKDFGNHCKYRNFTKDIPNNFKLIEKIENPFKGLDTQSDFYIYEKV